MANDGAQRESIARAYSLETGVPGPQTGVQSSEIFQFDFSPRQRDQLQKETAEVDQRLAEAQARVAQSALVLEAPAEQEHVIAHWTAPVQR